MKFCPNCGKQIPKNANVCPYCGTRLSNMNQIYPKSAPQPTLMPPVKSRGHRLHRLIIGVIIIVLLCLGGGYYHHAHQDHNHNEHSIKTVNLKHSLPTNHWRIKISNYDGPVKFTHHELAIQNDHLPINIHKRSILVSEDGDGNYYILKLKSRNGNHYHMKTTQIHVHGITINFYGNHLTVAGHKGYIKDDNTIVIAGHTFHDSLIKYIKNDWVFIKE